MKILAIDPGTIMGWAFSDGTRTFSGVENFSPGPRDSKGMRYIKFNKWIQEKIRLNPDLIVYEMPHLRGGAAAEVLAGFTTRIQEAGDMAGIDYVSVHSASVKKYITGKGNASKQEVLATIRSLYPGRLIQDDNEADALGILNYAWGKYCGPGT